MTTIGQNSASINRSELSRLEESGEVKEKKKSPPPARNDSFEPSTESEITDIRDGAIRSAADKLRDAGVNPVEALNGPNGDKIADKLKSDRFEVVKVGDSKTSSLKDSVQEFLTQLGDTGLTNEELQKMLEVKLASSKESREMDLVLTLLTFSTSNPTSVISSLKNLLGSLTSPAAKELAGSSISSVADFAKYQALSQAKYKGCTDAAKELLSALRGAISNAVCSCSCHSDGCSPEELHAHTEDLNSQVSMPGTHTEEFVIIDKETGEIATDEHGEELFFSVSYEDPDCCEENSFINTENETHLENSQGLALSSLNEANRLASNHNKKDEEDSLSKSELNEIRFAKNGTTNPNELKRITEVEKSLSRKLGLA